MDGHLALVPTADAWADQDAGRSAGRYEVLCREPGRDYRPWASAGEREPQDAQTQTSLRLPASRLWPADRIVADELFVVFLERDVQQLAAQAWA
jgi:hypothetical protein